MLNPVGLAMPIPGLLDSCFASPSTRQSRPSQGGIEQLPAVIIGGSAAELAAAMKNDMESTVKLIKTIGLQPE